MSIIIIGIRPVTLLIKGANLKILGIFFFRKKITKSESSLARNYEASAGFRKPRESTVIPLSHPIKAPESKSTRSNGISNPATTTATVSPAQNK